MPDLKFDLDKTYDENVEAFKQHVATLDSAMAEILFRHLDKLSAGDDPRSRASRTAFNRAVLTELETSPPAANGAL